MKHMQYLISGVLILTLATTCRSYLILSGGTQTERTQFCVGEELTLLCKDNTPSYEWVYPGGMIAVTPGRNISTANGFTATYVNATTTTLQFVVSRSLNGTTLTCINLNDAVTISSINIELFDMSSVTCPGTITAVGMDNCTSVDVSLHDVSRCTREYTASVSGETEIISSVLNEANHDVEYLAIGRFNLTNSSLELCSNYILSVNVTFFDNSSMACASIAVELPTNPSSASTTMQTVSTTGPPSSASLPVMTITIIVVVIGVGLLVLLAVIIMIPIILCLVKKSKKKLMLVKPQQENLIKANQDPQVILHEESPSGDVYAVVEKKNKGSKKTSKSDSKEKIFVNSKVNKEKDSEERSTWEGVINKDSQIIPHEESPSDAVYARVEKKNKRSKNSGKDGKNEEISMNAKEKNGEDSKKSNTQKRLVCTKTDVHIISKSSPSS